MPRLSTRSKKLQWKWIAISYIAYIAFYLLPIVLMGKLWPPKATGDTTEVFLGIWMFAGIFIVAALTGYFSKGITIWEPVIAGVGMALTFFNIQAFFIWKNWFIVHSMRGVVITVVSVFLLSLFGAWLGEHIQKAKKTKARKK